MSPVLKIIIVFVAVIVSLKLKSPLGISLFLGSIVLGLWMGMSVEAIGHSILTGITLTPNLLLLVIVVQIVLLSAVLQETKQLRKMVAAVREVVRNPRFTVPTMTAIIGLLPMPGGARFSAPLVDEAAQDLKTDAVHRSTINYWFRHIWEYWWPFYPSVIILSAITGFSLTKIFIVFLPATFIATAVGYFAYLRPMPKELSPGAASSKGSILRVLSIGRSIVVVIILNFAVVAARSILEAKGVTLDAIPPRAPLVLALIVGIVIAIRGTGLTARKIAGMVFNKRVAMTMLIIASILIFSQVLEDAGAVKDITETLKGHEAPLLLLAFSVPFLVSFVTGIVVAYVGIALPILYPVFVASVPQSELIAYVWIFFVSGFVAVLLTPVHLCLILSNEYFKVNFIQVAKLLIVPCIALMAIYFGVFFLYRLL